MWTLLLLVALTLPAQTTGRDPLDEARALFEREDYPRAAEWAEHVVEREPGFAPAWLLLGQCYEKLAEHVRHLVPRENVWLVRAETAYETAAERARETLVRRGALQHLAALYGANKLSEPERAGPIVERLIEMNPRDASNYLGLARIYDEAGREENALAMLHRAVDALPGDISVIMVLGEFHNSHGRFDQAMEVFERVCLLEPQNPQNHYQAAVRYEEKVRKDARVPVAARHEYIARGLAAIDRALELRADYFEAVVYRGLLLRQQAVLETDPLRQEALFEEADEQRRLGIEIQNRKMRGVFSSPACGTPGCAARAGPR